MTTRAFANVVHRRLLRAFAISVLLIACLAVLLITYPHVVRAQQDEHITAPKDGRDVGATAANPFVGSAKCLSCHKWVSSQMGTGMGMAALAPGGPTSLNYNAMTFHSGEYTVTMQQSTKGLQMTAADGHNSLSAPVRWIFGQGELGQTFLLEHGGALYESRASYYKATGGLDLTIGHASRPPASLIAALGRPLPNAEVVKCFSCHTSENVFESKLDVAKAHPGVTCENCHGAGGAHAVNMTALHGTSAKQDASIFNPASLPPADMNDFCGSCHRTTHDVLQSGVRDVRNVRFQPYRLENSRCYDPSDARITCVACHDPHRNLELSAQSYDAKCLACHARSRGQTTPAKASACPRADRLCITCHMPKTDLPGAHYAFTDHYIRVVQPNAPYPE